MKHETNGVSDLGLAITDPSKSMKRSPVKIQALVSPETDLVSSRFTFRFMSITRAQVWQRNSNFTVT
jgi:hypothetical protein